MTNEVEAPEVRFLPAVVEAREVTLYGTSDPNVILSRAAEQADALARVIDEKHLYANMVHNPSQTCVAGHARCAREKDDLCRRHVLYEGWALCGTLLGVFALVVRTEPLPDGDGVWQAPIITEEWAEKNGRRFKDVKVVREGRGGWKATAHAVTRDGSVVGGDDAVCSWEEDRWKHRSSGEVLGMAQTRAKSRALRGPLGFIVSLAGYAATPAEEMAEAVPAAPAHPITVDGGPGFDLGPWLKGGTSMEVATKRFAGDSFPGDGSVARLQWEKAVADVIGDSPVAEATEGQWDEIAAALYAAWQATQDSP